MQDSDPAQAAELIRALRDQLREMTHHLAWAESRGVTGTHGRASATQLEADALRRDIAEAQMHIDRLHRRYLSHSVDHHTDARAGTAASRPDSRTKLAVRR